MKTIEESGYGFKLLDPTGATYPINRRDGSKEMLYTLPRPGEKWGPWMLHPHPAGPDGCACGSGRYHVMLKLNAVYAPINWWPWFVQFDKPVGRDREKIGVLRLRLRRIAPRVLARALRPPFNWGHCANLRRANLSDANLSDANLSYADLSRANLCCAHLSCANLSCANLRYADLSRADLRHADLSYADLSHADLSCANLRYADLSRADLRHADLSYADLRHADLSCAERLTDEQLEKART